MSSTAKLVLGIALIVVVTLVVLLSVNVISSEGNDYIRRNHIEYTGGS